MITEEYLENKIISHLEDANIEVIDESAAHIGHVGHNKKGGSHFSITIVSDAFINLSKIKRHQIIYDILKEEMKQQIHALSLKTLTLEENQ